MDIVTFAAILNISFTNYFSCDSLLGLRGFVCIMSQAFTDSGKRAKLDLLNQYLIFFANRNCWFVNYDMNIVLDTSL